MDKIDDKAQYPDVLHLIMGAAEAYTRISVNVPKAFSEITQHIHGRFDDAAFNAFSAANTFDTETKIKCLRQASQDLFYQYTSIAYLVRTKATTIGAANEVLAKIKPAYDDTNKWLNATIKGAATQEESR